MGGTRLALCQVGGVAVSPLSAPLAKARRRVGKESLLAIAANPRFLRLIIYYFVTAPPLVTGILIAARIIIVVLTHINIAIVGNEAVEETSVGHASRHSRIDSIHNSVQRTIAGI